MEDRREDNMSPRTDNPVRIVKAASVIVFRRGSVLLVLRKGGGNAGRWSAPGGKCEAGENPQQTARRELAEETGLEVGCLAPVCQHAVGPINGLDRPMGYEISVFAAESETLSPPAAASDAADARFFDDDAIRDLPTTDGLAGVIAAARTVLASGASVAKCCEQRNS